MKKQILALAIAALMLSAVAFAGPYFSVETGMAIAAQSGSSTVGLEISPVFTGGYDFSTTIQSTDGVLRPRLFGDTHFTFPANDLDITFGMGFSGIKVEMGTLLDFNRELDELWVWNTSFTVTGYPRTGLKIWGTLSFNYDTTWTLAPVFGIEARW